MHTGNASCSEQELYHLLHQDKSRLLGLVSPKAATADDVQQLLQHAAALSSALNAQAGNGCELVVASSIWTKDWPINPEYAAAVKELFQVRLVGCCGSLPSMYAKPTKLSGEQQLLAWGVVKYCMASSVSVVVTHLQVRVATMLPLEAYLL